MSQQQLLWIILIASLFILPAISTAQQKKQQKARKAMLDALEKGDEIMTIGGFFGTVKQVKDGKLIVELNPDKILAEISVDAVSHKINETLDELSDDEEEYELVLEDDEEEEEEK